MRIAASGACALLLGLLSGCVRENERAGDEALAAHRYEDAAKAYDRAIADGDAYAYEKRRIDGKRVDATEGSVREGLGPARARGNLAELLALRKRAVDDSLSPDLLDRIQTAIDEALVAKSSEVEALVRRQRYGEAVEEQAALAGASRAGSPLRQRFDSLQREAAAYYDKRAETASSIPRRLLYGNLAHAFGGRAVSQRLIDDARAPLVVAWNVDVGRVRCGGAGARIASAFPNRSGGLAGTMRVALECARSQRALSRDETYTYKATEQYVEDQVSTVNVPTTVRTEGSTTCQQVLHEVWAPGASRSHNEYRNDCRTTPSSSRTEYRNETTHTPVTRTREVDRQGKRAVKYTEYKTVTSGRADVTVDGDVVSGELEVAATSEDNGDASESSAVRLAIGRLTELVGRAREKHAAPVILAGNAAARAGRTDEAEDAYVTAMLETGHVSPDFAGYLDTTLGIPRASAQAAAYEGAAFSKVDSAPSLAPRARREYEEGDDDGQRGGASGNEVVIAAAWNESRDLGPQSPRSVAGAYLHYRRGGISSLWDSTWGFGLYDHIELEGFLGARTTTGFRTDAGREEKSLGYGFGAAYRALLGYRASRFGIFGGVEPRVVAQTLGDVTQNGYFGPIVAQLELRISGPGVVTLTGWRSPTSSGTYSMGADLVIPFGRSSAGARLSAERRYLHTELPLATGDDESAREEVGIRETTLATAGIVFGF